MMKVKIDIEVTSEEIIELLTWLFMTFAIV